MRYGDINRKKRHNDDDNDNYNDDDDEVEEDQVTFLASVYSFGLAWLWFGQ